MKTIRKYGAKVETEFGKQSLIGILRPANHNRKYSACKVRAYTYSDMPFNAEITVQVPGGKEVPCLGTCAMHCKHCYVEGMLYGPNGKSIALSYARHTWLMRHDRDALFEGIRRRLRTLPAGSIVRLYAAGDFLDQDCVNRWTAMVIEFPELVFFGYTKKHNILDFSRLQALPNCNIVFGLVKGLDGKLRKNFGPEAEMRELAAKTGAYLCPCDLPENKDRKHVICLNECFACCHRQDVLFVDTAEHKAKKCNGCKH